VERFKHDRLAYLESYRGLRSELLDAVK